MIDSLIEVLQANNQRLEGLYNKYFKFKEKQIKKETVLKEKLTNEQKSYKELELKFESYKKEVSLNKFPLVSIEADIHNIIKDEKLALIRVLQSLEDQSSQVKDVLLNTIKSIQFMEEKCSVCVNTRQVSLKGIFDSETLSENLNTDIFKQKKIDDNNIKNQFFTTEALNKENIDKLRVEIEELNIKIMNLELLKNTETTRSFTALDDENARLKEQNEAYIRKLDVMTALHLQEIDQINYAMQEKNNLICSLNLNIENLNATIQKMNVDLGSIPTFNLQINTYENTIKAERATLEKLKEEMFNVNHCLEECNTENFILKKEISNLKQNSLSDIQQFCNTPSTMCEFDDFDMSSFKDRPEQSKF